MKKQIKKLKLNQLSKKELEKRTMNVLKGGRGCTCPYHKAVATAMQGY